VSRGDEAFTYLEQCRPSESIYHLEEGQGKKKAGCGGGGRVGGGGKRDRCGGGSLNSIRKEEKSHETGGGAGTVRPGLAQREIVKRLVPAKKTKMIGIVAKRREEADQ